MRIYDRKNAWIKYSTVVSDVPITKECQHVEELMKSDYVALSWKDSEKYALPVGSYIIPYPDESYDERYPLKYRLFERYDPEGKNEAEYDYAPQFQHPIMWLSRIPFFLYTGSIDTWEKALKKTSWSYTGDYAHIAGYITDVINWFASHYEQFGNTIGGGWSCEFLGEMPPSATVSFDAVDVMSAASEIASKFDCEFHFDFRRRRFMLGKIAYGTEVTLKSGDNVGVASVNRTRKDYHNAFLVKGSTRNLSQPKDTGESVQERERLGLDTSKYPDGVMYTDEDNSIISRDAFMRRKVPMLMQELIFDDVYPKLELYVYGCRERKCWLLDEETGERVPDEHGELDPETDERYKAYSKWYVRLAYPDYDPNGEVLEWHDYIIDDPETQVIDGRTLEITFIHNKYDRGGSIATENLIGYGDFEATCYNEASPQPEHGDDDISSEPFQPHYGDYRIEFKEMDGFIIPTTSNGGIFPKTYGWPNSTAQDLRNNMATLLNVVVDDTYKKRAQQELETVAARKVGMNMLDQNNYVLPSNPVYFESNDISLHIGQSVIYDDGRDLAGGTSYRLSTHIVKLETRLDFPFEQEITVGNELVKGTISSLSEKVDAISGGAIGGLWGDGISEEQFEDMLRSIGSYYFLSKRSDDTAKGLIRFIRGLQVGERFVTGLLGEGGIFRKDADGTTYIEADKLYIRMKAYFDSVEIRDYRHSAGNRIASVAGAKCCRVDWIDASGNSLKQTSESLASTVLFRCYFRGSDGEDEVRNNFIVGDLAYCHITTVETEDDSPIAKGLNMTHYWRLVVGRNPHGTLTDDGEHWIDLSNRVSETVTISGTSYTRKGYQPGSDVPAAQNDIIQLGNISENDRQGAIIEFVTGADAPSYQIFQGIGSDVDDPYSLDGKNYVRFGYDSESGGAQAYIGNPDGSSYIWYHLVTEKESTFPRLDIKANVRFLSPTTHQETTIEDFADAVTNDIEYIQNQIDGELDTWYYDGVPTLANAPAKDWTTDDEKKKHVGDLYYDKGTGYVYRFLYDNDNERYYWTQIHDDAISEALRIAGDAQDTADNKRRVFVEQPKPISPNTYVEYDVGDLWVNATYPANYSGDTDAKNGKYKNDLLSCKVAKPKRNEQGTVTDGTFSIDDWELATKYGTALQDFIDNKYNVKIVDLEKQIDGKAETWYQASNPADSSEWVPADHEGDLWYCTEDIAETDYKKSTTWFYKKVGSTYKWVQQDIPDAVFDRIDGKAQIFTSTPDKLQEDGFCYHENDLWLLSEAIGTDYKQGEVLTAKQKSTTFNLSHWERKLCYTDDAELNSFLEKQYAEDKENLQKQIDKKAETWVSSSNPAEAWYDTTQTPVKDERSEHVGDMWLNTSNATVAGVGTMKTAIYKKNGSKYSWVVDDTIPNSVFDTIDGKKAIYVTWSSIEAAMSTNKLQVRDILIPSSDITQGGKTYTKNKVYRCTAVGAYSDGSITTYPTFVEIAYTDDSALTTFLNEVYGTTVLEQIKKQNDKKAETWYQNQDPSTRTPSQNPPGWKGGDDESHIGDIWHNTNTVTINGVEAGRDAIWTGTEWEMSDVPQNVYDTIDGKADIFVSKPSTYNKNDMWIIESSTSTCPAADIPDGCERGDIVIAKYKRTKNYTKADWVKHDRYTDDKKVNEIINKYGEILDITPDAENVGEAVAWLDKILHHPSGTQIAGGLVLTSLIAMQGTEATPKVWGGMNGAYQSKETDTGYKGHGIAAWYGGQMVDKEVQTTATDYAKSLFRFDGSGYVAGGNLSWDKSGNVTIKGKSVDATTLKIDGQSLDTKYVTIDTAQTITGAKTFGTADGSYIQIGAVRIVYDATNNALKIVGSDGSSAANFYATGGVSALGAGSGGSSGGGVDMATVWSALRNATDEPIALSHLTGALSAYNPTSNFKTINGNSIIGTGNITIESSGGTVSAVKVGTTTYNPTSGVVSLPAYPSTLDNISDGSTRKLANYLPLTGGTMTGDAVFKSTSSAKKVGAAFNYGSNGGGKIYSAGSGKVNIDGGTYVYLGIGDSSDTVNGKAVILAASSSATYFKPLDANTGVFDLGTSSARWNGIYGTTLDVTGDSKVQTLTLTSTSGVAHLIFSRGSYNYITAPASGSIAFVTGGKKVNSTNTDLRIADGAVTVNGTLSASGNTSVGGTLGVTGDATLGGAVSMANGKYLNIKNTSSTDMIVLYVSTDNNVSFGYGYRKQTSGTYLYGGTKGVHIMTNGTTTRLFVNSAGNVSIGSTTASFITEKLNVNGNVKATKFIGALQGNADTATTATTATNATNADTAAACTGNSATATKLKTARKIWGQSFNGTAAISGDMTGVGNMTLADTARIHQPDVTGAELFIGNESNNGWVKLADACSQSGNTYWSLLANGQANFVKVGIGLGSTAPSYTLHVSGNIYATKAVTCLSDIREKTIVRQTGITVEQIAAMRSIVYRWKDNGDDHDEHVGSIAQDWQKALPQVVLTANDGKKTLSMQYGVASLVSSITIARKVVDHERRIKELENENRRLKEQLKIA